MSKEGEEKKRKKVVVALTIQTIVDVPEDWDKDRIEFWLNGSSSCIDNVVGPIAAEIEAADEIEKMIPGHSPCFCFRTESVYVRDAGEEDLHNLQFTEQLRQLRVDNAHE